MLQPLSILHAIKEEIAMDFITRLPKTNGKAGILEVIDLISKYAHFSSLPKHFIPIPIAKVFFVDINKLHVIPKVIISNRDPMLMRIFLGRVI